MKKLDDTNIIDTLSSYNENYSTQTHDWTTDSIGTAILTKTPITEIISLASKLISFRSTAENHEERESIVALASNYMKDLTVDVYESNAIKSLLVHNNKPGTKHFKILLNGHLDVVPGKDEQYVPYEKNGRLYGKGAYDMKAAVAVMMTLLKELNKDIHYPIALQITSDEEQSGINGAKYQVDQGVRGEFILSGECGSNFHIKNEAKGGYFLRLLAEGKASHGAYPWNGDNAISKLYRVLHKIHEKYPSPQEESHNTTVSVTKIHSTNNATNRIPDHCEAGLDIRYTVADTDIIDRIKSLLPKDIALEIIVSWPPLKTAADNKYIQLLKSISQPVLQKDLPLVMGHGTSDLMRFAGTGCDGIEFGPIGGNQHQDDEWVDIQSLADYYQILKKFLLSVK
ncbi:MAG: M20/M25/M40 family metallo-hydrolase [Candidatus Levybacteria bacterium]|nr:M20/M25/M40 family metallo-hydrolase [Candidatus Levybacteria bacterium]